jgi:hypothetical protein
MAFDTVLTVRLRSYGFFHSGRERLRVRVVKRCWEFIPGSTLYGAVAAALIRLDGLDPDEPVPLHGNGGYQRLLQAVAGGQIRFTPLLPDPGDPQPDIHTAQDYCRTALWLRSALYGDPLPEAMAQAPEPHTLRRLRGVMQTTPHAPLDRRTLQVHESDLYATAVHRQRQAYSGFIFAGAPDLPDLLRPALRYLPLLPFGGKGKFTCVEAELEGEVGNLPGFQAELEGYLAGLGSSERVEVRLLTPLALQDGDDSLLMRRSEEMYFSRLRRYRAWRTGHYYAPYDPDAQDGFVPVGLDREENVPRGTESTPVLGVPEGSRFRFSVREETRAELCAELARAFVEGDGNPAWTYLGWGQVVMA